VAFHTRTTSRARVGLLKLSFGLPLDCRLRLHSGLLTQAIAHPANCVDQVIAKLLSQVADVDINYVAGWVMT